MATDRTEWLASLKPGDEVAVFAKHGYVILTVKRLTKTQIVTERGRFRRIDGRNIGGDDWNIVRLEPVTASMGMVRRSPIRRALQADMDRIDWHAMTFEQLIVLRDVMTDLPKKEKQ